MADRPEDRPADLSEERARRALDRIAERHRHDPGRLEEFVSEQRQAEEAGPVTVAVRAAILGSGLSLYELEKRTGVAASQLSRFLNGERSLTVATLDRLAEELKLEVKSRRRRRK